MGSTVEATLKWWPTMPKDNLVTVRKSDGELVTYDPSRLRGIPAYQEIERDFAIGDRVQLTTPNRVLQTANRDLGTLKGWPERMPNRQTWT